MRKKLNRTCDVPQLQAHRLLVPVEHFEGEVHPDGGSVVGAEVVVDVPLDDAGLADPEVPDHKDLVEMLLVVVVLHGDRGGGRELSMNPPQWREDRGATEGGNPGPRAEGTRERAMGRGGEGGEVR